MTAPSIWPLRGVDGRTFAEQRAERDRLKALALVDQKRRDAAAAGAAAYAQRERDRC